MINPTVNAIDKSTRARSRVGAVCFDANHELINPSSSSAEFQRDQMLTGRRAALARLTPAQRRLLEVVYDALLIESTNLRVQFREHVNRYAIAAALGKEKLVPYDLQKLDRLISAGLLVEDRRALPVKVVKGADGTRMQLGSGFEYVYSLSDASAYVLTLERKPHAFDVMKQRAQPRGMHRAALVTQQDNQALGNLSGERAQQPSRAAAQPRAADDLHKRINDAGRWAGGDMVDRSAGRSVAYMPAAAAQPRSRSRLIMWAALGLLGVMLLGAALGFAALLGVVTF